MGFRDIGNLLSEHDSFDNSSLCMNQSKEVTLKLKEYECVEVKHHKDVGRTIKEWQENGWRLHTYQATGSVGPASAFVNHYLLFEKGE